MLAMSLPGAEKKGRKCVQDKVTKEKSQSLFDMQFGALKGEDRDRGGPIGARGPG